MSLLLRTSLAMLAVLALASCRIGKSTDAARQAVETFHQQYNNSEFAAIYSGTSPAFKKTTSEADFVKSMRENRAKFGKFQSASQSGMNISVQSSRKLSTSGGWESEVGTTITLTYSSQFEHGPAVETITFLASEQKASLQNYKCEAPGTHQPGSSPTNRPREYI